ncbi:MAG: hypothetical protein ACPGMR_07820 [Pontibacterium sp.]
MKPTRKDIATFWTQLEQTIDQLLTSRSENEFDADFLLEDYRHRLHQIDRNLTFHFQTEGEGTEIEMVFGCDGFPESIQSVLSLVGEAPVLDGIRFKAFNQRSNPIPNDVYVGDECCNINDYWYRLRLVEGRLLLEVYMKHLPKVLDLDPRVEGVMIFLDTLIGEYEVMTRISQLDWFELPEMPEDYGLQLLRFVRDDFDQYQVQPIGFTMH